MTLKEWSDLQPATVKAQGVNMHVPDVPTLVDRAAAFRLTDYVVSGVTGGTIWFFPRYRDSAQAAMLLRGTSD